MRRTFLFLFLLTVLNPAFSQKYGEVGIFVGGTFFMGDVYSDVSNNTGLTFGVDYRQNFNSRWAWRSDFQFGKISGDDANSNIIFEQQRNLSFHSNYYMFSSVVEFNFLKFEPYKPQSFFKAADVFTPYAYVGLSLLYHNPKANLAGNEYELRPLQTEGVNYSKVTMGLPFGFGFKFHLTDRFLLGITGGFCPTFTDYLDDVSTRYPNDPSQLSKTGRDLSNRSLEAQGPNNISWGAQRGYEYNKDWLSSVVISLNFNLRKNPGNCHFNPNK